MAKIEIKKSLKRNENKREIEDFQEGKNDNIGSFKRAALSIMKDVLEESNKQLKEVGAKDFQVSKVINTTFVQNLASIGMNLQTIAGIFGITDRQLRNIFREKPELQIAFLQGRAISGINYLGMAHDRMEEKEDTGNKILMTFLAETTGISEKRINVMETHTDDEEKINKEELKNEIMKSLIFKVNKVKDESEAIEGDFSEINEDIKKIEGK